MDDELDDEALTFARRRQLTQQIFATLTGADPFDAHAAIVQAVLLSLDRMLHESAAVGELPAMQVWLERQIEQLTLYVLGWHPGTSPADAARKALSADIDERRH